MSPLVIDLRPLSLPQPITWLQVTARKNGLADKSEHEESNDSEPRRFLLGAISSLRAGLEAPSAVDRARC
jgi:hypothetical protein